MQDQPQSTPPGPRQSSENQQPAKEETIKPTTLSYRSKWPVVLLCLILLVLIIVIVVYVITRQKHIRPTHNSALTGTNNVQNQSKAPLTQQPSAAFAIRVSGNQLVDGQNKSIQLVGVNITASGDCVPIGNQPVGDIYPLTQTTQQTTIQGLHNWHVNVVRLTMNEDCWLGINNVKSQYSGANYQNQITAFVDALTQNGIYVDVDMHTNGPGTYISDSQQIMADADHAITYWQSVAKAFQGNPAVMFDVYNEPRITLKNAQTTNPWDCWRNGCVATETDTTANKPIPDAGTWRTAGMQSLVSAIRGTGATNPILLGGLNWSQDLSEFLQYLPSDPQHQLIASYHNYVSATSKNSLSYWNAVIAPVATQMPVITTEFGEQDGGTNYVSQYMAWADQHKVSYIAWAWVPSSVFGKLGLVTSLDGGTPSAYGQVLYNHYRSVNP